MKRKILPPGIRLEASSVCQLKCPSCPTASGAIRSTIKAGYLKVDYLRELLEKNPWVKDIELSNYGEVFLNPQFLQILECAHTHGIALSASNGVNLNTVKPEVLEGLVKYKFKALNCSIDGASNETYSQYRVGGNFDTVIKNIKIINAYKEQYQSKFPILNWQFIIFGFNEHEIEAAKKLAAELNMTIRFKLSWDESISPIKNPAAAAAATNLGVSSRTEYAEKKKSNYMASICEQLWTRPQINWDGKMLGCCFNFWGDFGIVESGDLESAINSDKMDYGRMMLMGKVAPKQDIPCSTCSHYEARAKFSDWISEDFDKKARGES